MSVDPRDEIIAELRKANELLRERVRILEAQVADLKERLGKSSRNSSKPPSLLRLDRSAPDHTPTLARAA